MSSRATKRLISELHDFDRSAALSRESGLLHLAPVNEDDLMIWSARIRGPPDTAFEAGIFDLTIEISSNYPVQPPKISFTEPRSVFHPNVHAKTGEICLDILKQQWSPVWTLATACWAIQALLADPEPGSPLNIDAANLLRCGDRLAFESMVKMCVAIG